MIYLTGFLLGFVGSLHCIGMCGPIALALPVPQNLNRILAVIFYNLGRIVTYYEIGLFFGLIGKLIVLAGFQQTLSVVCGIVVISLAFFAQKVKVYPVFSGITKKFKSGFSVLVNQHGLLPFVLLAMLNGLLPCGLVYMSLAAATATGGSWSGAFFMACFGLGTAPAMFAKAPIKLNLTRYKTGFVVFTGLLLIVCGLNLGIPYLSPEVNRTAVQPTHYKCH